MRACPRMPLGCHTAARAAEPGRFQPGGCGQDTLKKRKLTNTRPPWLADAHAALDAVVAAAYGWPADIVDEDVLRELSAPDGSGS